MRIKRKTFDRRGRLLSFWLMLFAIGFVATTAGCGGGGGDDSGGGGGGQSWSVTGNPPSSIMAGAQFTFTPTVSNPNGVSLTFSITNPPSWATFSTATGTISGTPGAGDVGTYSNITVSVTDGQTTITRGPYTIQVVATATGSATLTWTPPTTYTDNSPLVVASYKVRWGTTQGSYPNVTSVPGGVASHVVEQLTPGTWYFVVTALDAAQIESAYSNVASKIVQ